MSAPVAGIEPLLGHAVPFGLVMARLAGLFVFAPVLANRTFPRRFRVLLTATMALAVYPTLPAAAQVEPSVDLLGLVPLLVGELLLGVVIGLIAALPIICLDLGGFVMGHQMGLSLARSYDPGANTDTDAVGQLLMYLGLATFLALGGLEALYAGLIFTFGRLPAGGLASGQVPLDVILAALSSGFELGLRVSVPVAAVVFLAMIALGLLSKTVPQFNIMTVGFTLKIILGLLILLVSVGAIQAAVGEHVEQNLRGLGAWIGSLGAGARPAPIHP